MDAVANNDVRAQAAPLPQAGEAVAQVTDAQIEHMVQRFLGWRLPETFGPDAGIRFERVANAGTPYEYKHEPVGTNLFDYTEAKAMVLHMLEGLPAAIGDPVAWHALCTKSGGQMVHTIKSSLVEDADRLYGKNQWTLTPLTAAIGAGGQAVTDSLWVSAKPEHKKIGWTYDFDQTERLSRAAEKATGYEGTMEVIEFVMAEADRRHKSALSQPHPADERVAVALREIADGCTGRIDRDSLPSRIARAALSAAEGR